MRIFGVCSILLVIIAVVLSGCMSGEEYEGSVIKYVTSESSFNETYSYPITNLMAEDNQFAFFTDVGGYSLVNKSGFDITKIRYTSGKTSSVNLTYNFHTPAQRIVICTLWSTGEVSCGQYGGRENIKAYYNFDYSCNEERCGKNSTCYYNGLSHRCALIGEYPHTTLIEAEIFVPKGTVIPNYRGPKVVLQE